MAISSDPLQLATDYNWDVVGYSGNLPLDVCRSVLENYKKIHKTANYSGLKYRVGGYLLCPMCSTPWIAGNVRPRLISGTSNIQMKKLLNKERKKPSKLTKMEKIFISAYRQKGNIIELKCTRCNHEMREVCPKPEKQKKKKLEIEKSISTPNNKKKKKRKSKEVNAGLNVSSTSSISFNSTKRSSNDSRSVSSISESFVHDTSSFSESVFHSEDSLSINRETEQNISENNSRNELSSLSSLDDQQLLAQRLSESITSTPQHLSYKKSRQGLSCGPGSRSNSSLSSRSGFTPSSRLGSHTESPEVKKKEKQRKLAGLKNAMLKESKKLSDKQKNNSLDDFLKTDRKSVV